MSTIRHFKAGRNYPTPAEDSSWNFRLWSYGFMRPLHCVNHVVALSNIPQTLMQVLIPANSWAHFKVLRVYADFELHRQAPIPVFPVGYQESYTTLAGPVVNRGPIQNINPGSITTRYYMERIFIFEAGGNVYEQNVGFFGEGYIGSQQGVDTRLNIVPAMGGFDNSIDNYIIFQIMNNDPTTNDVAQIHTSQAFLQAPLNLGRFPQ